jgi:phosphonate transport system substrate-binding protein
MLNRRTFIASLSAVSLASTARPSAAEDWRARFPELIFAVVPGENSAAISDRWGPMVRYLEREIGAKITMRVVPDYAAVIEGQRAGQIHIAWHGASSYARARTIGVQVEPFAIDRHADGSTGYYSVFYVKATSTFQRIEDMRGKILGLVDPNSTSGNNVPRLALDKMGIRPQEFFSRVIYAGSHENALIALGQGTVDVAATWLNSDTDSNLARMTARGMLRAEDFRPIFRSDLIMAGPYTYLSNLPQDLKDRIRDAWLSASAKDEQAVLRVFDGKAGSFTSVAHDAYLPIIELNQFVDRLRRQAN